jgi:protein TonB
MDKTNIARSVIFVVVAGLHGVLIFFAAFSMNAAVKEAEPAARTISLVDIREDIPLPPPPPPPPPPERPPEIFQNTVEAAAETLIEADEVPEEIVVREIIPVPSVRPAPEIEYLPQHRITTPPSFPEQKIRDAIVYPPIALRSGTEGLVYLELFVDSRGEIRQITVLRETPPERGFGEAAVNAFKGIRAAPAQADGRDVGVRWRYPIRFTIR